MGLLTEVATENKAQHVLKGSRDKVITESAKAFEIADYRDNYKSLGEMLASNDPKVEWRAANTIKMIENTRIAYEGLKATYGEATVQQSLGPLNTRVLDVVRVFYPNLIAQELVDIQPIDGEIGQIFTLKPKFASTFDNITDGDEMFRTYATNNNYASEFLSASIGTGDGSTTTFTKTLTPNPVRPGTIKITGSIGSTTLNGVDSGSQGDTSGTISGTGITSGTINYTTGVLTVVFASAPTSSDTMNATYSWDSEQSASTIRKIKFEITNTPVQCKPHPLNFEYSVPAGLAAQAHLQVDVQDVLSTAAGHFIKNERDERLIQLIAAAATADSTLNFNASTTSLSYDKKAFYSEVELKVDAAESIIQATNGRGGVDFVLCGNNAANLFRNSRTFQAAPVTAPIGAHVIGYLRDGTVAVVKSLTLNTNTFVVGYKGYMAGDSATILAEWVPLYFTPVFQNPNLLNSQGVMSMYDLFVNNAGYYVKGTISNYGA